MENQETKVYYGPGNIVRVRQELDYNPLMVVKTVQKATTSSDGRSLLLGVQCYWFTKTGEYQERLFNTKDLELISQATADV